MKTNLETCAYLALVTLYQVNKDGDMSNTERETTQALALRLEQTPVNSMENVDIVGMSFAVIMDYLKEQGV